MGASKITSTRRPLFVAGTAAALIFIYVHMRAYFLYWPLTLGMSTDEIVDRLGAPQRIEQTLIFCHPYIPWSGLCPAEEGARRFLFYKVGIDRWIIVGDDEQAQVVFLTLGDT